MSSLRAVDAGASENVGQWPLFARNQTISSRYEALLLSGLIAPSLPVDQSDVPREINSTLLRHRVEWSDLGGTLQRLLLWDAGFVIANRSRLVRTYVKCGRTMDDTVIAHQVYATSADCPVRTCDSVFTSAGECSSASLLSSISCAADGDGQPLPLHRTSWSEEAPNSDIPFPSIYRSSNRSYSIHMQDQLANEDSESCPQSLRVVIPCAQFDSDVKWCVPKPSEAVERVLDRLQSTAAAHRSSHQTKSLLLPIVGLATMIATVLATVVFMLSRRRAKEMTDSVDGIMNFKQRTNDTMMTTASDQEPDFIYVDTKDTAAVVPSMDLAASRPPSLMSCSASSTLSSCSYTDQINASDVLIAFQSDPLIVSKRVPMIDVEFSRRLCSGGSGEVFLGRIHRQRVALKQLLRMKRNDLSDVENFAKEIQLTALLDHPNIIRMVGVAWNTFQNLTLVLEYRSGGDLLNALRKRGTRWTWNAEKLRVALGVARAMAYLHGRAHPLVHRDIKSRNILVDHATIEPALCDFGSSRNVSALDLLSTDPGGTILWSAPEVINAQEYSVKADIYSFGIVLAELDTCTLPYTEERDSDGRPVQAIRIAHMVVENRIKPQLTEHCPRFIREIVMECVRHKPHRRPTAEAILTKLGEAASDCAALWKSAGAV